MNTALVLTVALVLDAIFGEPRWLWSRLPHPVVVMGHLIKALDVRLNAGAQQRLRGCVALGVLVTGAAVLGWGLSFLGPVPSILITAILIAQKSLVTHVAAIGDGLRLNTQAGRDAVAMIVSRDTKDMDDAQVARSAIESGAENLSDGVFAPAFWFLIAGLPGVLIYKITNTADSMIGYQTPRYKDFGWATAKFDDILNWIPARLTALCIAVTYGVVFRWGEIIRDAKRHKSPNAGWPEAAAARALGVSLAGPRSYDGEMQDLAWVNPSGLRNTGAAEVEAAVDLLWKVWTVGFVICASLGALRVVLEG